MLTRLIDGIRESIGEITSVIFYAIPMAYVMQFIFGENINLAYIGFLLIPLFLIYAPYIKRQQGRGVLEMIVKTPAYLFISLVVFAIAYSNMVYNGPSRTVGVFLLCLGLLAWLTYRTLKKYSVPKEFKPMKDRRYPVSMWVTLILSLFFATFVVDGLIMVYSADYVGYTFFSGTMAIIIFGTLTLMTGTWFLITLLQGRK